MPRKPKWIRPHGNKLQVNVRVNGRLCVGTFEADTPFETMRDWRKAQRDRAPLPARGGTIEGDVFAFLERPDVEAKPSFDQLRAHLVLWLDELGRTRTRGSITRDDIEAVLQRWLKRLAEPTVYHRRSALLALYVALDGDTKHHVVLDTTVPQAWVPRDQSVDYATLDRILAAMPAERHVKKGIRQPSAARLVAAVLMHTGARGCDWLQVRRSDVDLQAGTVRMPGSKKGQGTAPWTMPLTPEGLDAVRAFDIANLYGRFNPAAVSHSFKRAARRVLGPDTLVHLYSLRHSIGADLYRERGDLATVARLLGHSENSVATAQYARGAHAEVDRAALAALSAARSAAVQKPAPATARRLSQKLSAPRKASQVNKLRKVV